jgi:iron-sulfur cluster assembly protein
MIKLTDKAASKVRELLERESGVEPALRLGIRDGGCSGLTYTLDFDTRKGENDRQFEDKGIRIVVDEGSFLYLAGTELDYRDGLTGAGFTFSNPNAKRSCGCGSSFKA